MAICLFLAMLFLRLCVTIEDSVNIAQGKTESHLRPLQNCFFSEKLRDSPGFKIYLLEISGYFINIQWIQDSSMNLLFRTQPIRGDIQYRATCIEAVLISSLNSKKNRKKEIFSVNLPTAENVLLYIINIGNEDSHIGTLYIQFPNKTSQLGSPIVVIQIKQQYAEMTIFMKDVNILHGYYIYVCVDKPLSLWKHWYNASCEEENSDAKSRQISNGEVKRVPLDKGRKYQIMIDSSINSAVVSSVLTPVFGSSNEGDLHVTVDNSYVEPEEIKNEIFHGNRSAALVHLSDVTTSVNTVSVVVTVCTVAIFIFFTVLCRYRKGLWLRQCFQPNSSLPSYLGSLEVSPFSHKSDQNKTRVSENSVKSCSVTPEVLCTNMSKYPSFSNTSILDEDIEYQKPLLAEHANAKLDIISNHVKELSESLRHNVYSSSDRIQCSQKDDVNKSSESLFEKDFSKNATNGISKDESNIYINDKSVYLYLSNNKSMKEPASIPRHTSQVTFVCPPESFYSSIISLASVADNVISRDLDEEFQLINLNQQRLEEHG